MKSPDSALRNAWHEIIANPLWPASAALGNELIARYAEPQRVFHTGTHLAQVLAALTAHSSDRRLQLAAWFHDAVYQPGHSDNEQQSASLARSRLAGLGYASDDIAFIEQAVLATASHRCIEPAFALLLDADLSILGSDAKTYDGYARAIRAEFDWLPAVQFNEGRSAFLRAMLSRPQIFATPPFQKQCESNARDNLRRELTALQAKEMA